MPDQPTEPIQSGRASGDSVELLQQILARLHTMEGGLSQHEEWLRRMEQDHHQPGSTAGQDASAAAPADSSTKPGGEEDVRRLIGALTLERDRANKNLAEAERQIGQYQQDLAAIRPQLAEMQKQAVERERQFRALKETSSTQIGQAQTVQSEARRQLQDHQQDLQTAQDRLQSLEQQVNSKDQRIAELQTALSQAASKLESAAARATAQAAAGVIATENAERWPRFARTAVTVITIAGLVSVGLTTALYERVRAGANQSASCTIILPNADAQTLQQYTESAAQYEDVTATADPANGRVELIASARNGSTALLKLDEVAKALIATLPPASASALTAPTSQPEGQRLAARIRESQRQGASMSQPAGADNGHAVDLAAQYKALQAERNKINIALADLARHIEARPADTSTIAVTSDQIAKAEAANPQLQAEFEALKQREEQLADRLRIVVDAASVQFRSIHKTLAAVDGEFDQLLKDEHPEEVIKQLQTMRESLKNWDRAVNDLEAQWQVQHKSLHNALTVDILVAQASLQKSAQAFVDDATKAMATLTQSVNAISQGQDQTTKRLVLRNNLVKQLSPVTTAQDAVLTAARSAILTNNVELTAIVQRLDSLRRQVHQRRAQIAAGLHQDRVNRVQQDHEAILSKARQEQARLKQRSAEIEAELQRLGEAGVQAAANLAVRASSLTQQTALQQQELRDSRQLLALHEQYARQIAALPAPLGPTYTPARLLAGAATGPTLPTVLLIGAAPVLASGLLLLIVGLITASRRSRNTIEEYARSLKDIAHRDDAKQPISRAKSKSR